MSAIVRKSDEWLKQRRSRIGGSNAAAAVGLSPWKTPVALYYEMTEGRVEDISGNPDVLRGIFLEPVCRQRLADELGMEIIEHDQDIDIRNEKFPWAGSTPDGFIIFDGAKIPVELKVPRSRNWQKLDEEVPTYIDVQCVHNAAVIGAPVIMLACMCPESLAIFRQLYEPKQDAIDALMEAESAFWNNHIVPRSPPPPQNESDLKLRWPEAAAGTRINATAEIEEDMHALAGAKLQEKQAKEQIEDISLRVKTFMADREALVSESGRTLATYKSHIETRLDSKILKAEAPDVWSKFARDKPVRVFLTKTKNLIS